MIIIQNTEKLSDRFPAGLILEDIVLHKRNEKTKVLFSSAEQQLGASRYMSKSLKSTRD